MCGAQGEEEGVTKPPRGTGCPHIFLCDVPDVIHIFNIAFVFNSSNGDGLFTHFRGDILLYFDP